MWSPDADAPRSKRRTVWRNPALVAVMAVVLAGCSGVQPLYQSGGGAGNPGATSSAVEAQLAAIEVEAQATRVGQRLRNDLIFRLGGGSNPAGITGGDYTLDLRVASRSENLLVRPELNRSTGRFITVVATYTLRRPGQEQVATTGTVQRSAAIEVTDQAFAAERAELDAENRASADVADSMRTELAAWFATRR